MARPVAGVITAQLVPALPPADQDASRWGEGQGLSPGGYAE